MTTIDDLDQRTSRWLAVSSDVAGNLSGATLSVLLSGLSGEVAAAAMGPIVARLFYGQAKDFAARMLSDREADRIRGVMTIAAERIEEMLRLGYELRSDDFFAPSDSGRRSIGSEVAEGVLIAAQREHQEEKLFFLGRLLAAIAFSPAVDRHLSSQLIRTLSELSYQQLAVLAAIELDELRFTRDRNYWPDDPDITVSMPFDLSSLLFQIEDLWRRSLVGLEPVKDTDGHVTEVLPEPHALRIIPARLCLWGLANVLVKLADLHMLSRSETGRIRDTLT